eukprot:4875911-Pyramimonas_sp.AAC.1
MCIRDSIRRVTPVHTSSLVSCRNIRRVTPVHTSSLVSPTFLSPGRVLPHESILHTARIVSFVKPHAPLRSIRDAAPKETGGRSRTMPL